MPENDNKFTLLHGKIDVIDSLHRHGIGKICFGQLLTFNEHKKISSKDGIHPVTDESSELVKLFLAFILSGIRLK